MSARKLVPILLVVAVAAGAAFALLRRKVDLVLVNPTAAAVNVTVNGAPYAVPPTGTLLVEGLSPDLQLAADGVRVGGVDTSASAKTWVWSVAPVTSWWTVNKGYGDRVGAAPATTAFVPSSTPVFALPDDYAQRVDAPLPENATVKKGLTGTVLRALWSDAFAARTAPSVVTLAVHNDSTDALRIEVNGVTAATLPADAVMHVPELPPGHVKLRAVVVDAAGKDGKEYTQEADLNPAPPFSPTALHVWDVTGTSHFWVLSRRYAPNPDADGPPPGPAPFKAPAAFFSLPPGFLNEIDAPFPDTWPRQEVLTALWCEEYFEKHDGTGIPIELRKRAAEKAAGGTPVPPPAPPQLFPPVDGERKGN